MHAADHNDADPNEWNQDEEKAVGDGLTPTPAPARKPVPPPGSGPRQEQRQGKAADKDEDAQDGESDTESEGRGPSPAQLLMQYAEDEYRMIRSSDGRTYAVPKDGPNIAVPLASRGGSGIRTKLAMSLLRRTGKVATSSALSDCINVLEGEAAEKQPEPVFLRMGRHRLSDGATAVVVDMGSETDRSVIITAQGWTLSASSPVVFRRSELIHPLPEPVRGGALDGLRALVNLTEEDFRLAIGWVVAAYLIEMPHPILFVQGEQGTAKSSLVRTLLALVDPQPAADREAPADKREWAIFSRASWAFSFDNLTEIAPWLSNSLCKGVTGDAVLQRVLHSDEDIAVFSFQRVIALTTIGLKHEIAGDLADRMLMVEPDVIDTRLSEAEVTKLRDAAVPHALGAILDLVSAVLRHLPTVEVADLPRMADFARILAALDAATGWTTLAAYRGKVAAMGADLIEGDRLAQALYLFATDRHTQGCEPWQGTARELIPLLSATCRRHRIPADQIPTDYRVMGRKVREIAPALRKVGVDVRVPSRTGKRRFLLIKALAARPEERSTPSSDSKGEEPMSLMSPGPETPAQASDINPSVDVTSMSPMSPGPSG
ncbi:ATP-binding protein [Actinomadura rudentiformis]|uniref:ATP-binding protein n=1 Tax=Actinomadura rudentiformis TaxID=359158 RepID=A0A6H9Z692_9ACTN|nr:ATP-binding protein [Actinomadura rudentiformis]KAB2351619.1 ATP-binding protein [Actinomadura rudentiformis]